MLEIYGQKGGKGGGSSSSGTSEDPNTLSSHQYFKVIDWISYGACGGLRGDDIRKSVILNGSPIMNPDGSINHQGVTIEQRLGMPDQEYMKGFGDAVSSEESVGVEVRKDSPVVRTINNLSCDSVAITIRFAQMTRVDGNSIHGASVEWSVDIKPSDGAWHEVLVDTVDGKTTSEYTRQKTINLTGTGPWNVRVRRNTDDSTSTNRVDAFTWHTYAEITDGKFTWPNIAYVGLKFDAKLFGSSLPSRAYDFTPVEVRVPSNYDPIKHTYYSQFWDGTFKYASTENPIWHAYDVVTSDMSGVSCDKFEMYALGKYCDEFISDGMGGTRPRFTINTTLTERRPAIEWLSDIMSSCRGMFYWDGEAIKFLLDQPAAVERYLLPENISEEGFKVQGSSIDSRYTVVNVTFNDPDNLFASTVETVMDHDGVRKYGYISKDVTAVGCTNRAQAHMYGKWILYCDLNETHRLNFKPVIDNADLRPGMIIGVTDGKRAGVRLGGRIKSYDAANKNIVVDKLPEDKLTSGQKWNLAIRTDKGEWETISVSSIDTAKSQITLSTALKNNPVDHAPWVMIGEKITPELWKVISISEDDGEYEVNCVEHHPNKYAWVEQGVYLEETPHSAYEKGALAPPTNLSMMTSKVMDGTVEKQRLTLSWTSSVDSRTDHYAVSVKRPSSSSYETLSTTTMCSVDIDNAEPGKWSFRVAALSNFGTASPWAVYSSEVSNLLLPVAPDRVETQVGNHSVTLAAFKSSNVGQTFEFWMSEADISAGIEQNARHVADGDNVAVSGLQPDKEYFFYVRGSNNYGVSRWYPLQVKTTINFSEEMKLINEQINAPGGLHDVLVNDAKSEAQKAVEGQTAGIKEDLKKQGNAFNDFKQSTNIDQTVQNLQIQLTQAHTTAGRAAVTTENITRVTNDDALASQVTTVSANLDNLSATVREEMTAEVNKLNETVNAQWTIETQTSNGKTSAVGLKNNGKTSEFGVLADRFYIQSNVGGEWSTPFVIQDGRVWMNSAMIGNGTIGGYLQSDNYQSGSAGWRLNKDGYLEAVGGKFIGNVEATSLKVQSQNYGGGLLITEKMLHLKYSNGNTCVRMGWE